MIKPQTKIIEYDEYGEASALNPWQWRCLNTKWDYLINREAERREQSGNRRAEADDYD